jgi:hypothetical protein
MHSGANAPIIKPIKPLSFEEFLTLNKSNPEQKDENPARHLFAAETVQEYINNFDYSNLENFFFIHLDFLDAVQSSIVMDRMKYPTGIALIRDARQALPLEKRLPPDSIFIEIDNLLLRALGTLRGIDHVLKYKKQHSNDDCYDLGRSQLQDIFRHLVLQLTATSHPDLKKSQQDFNTHLITVLHETGLDAGIKKSKSFAKLLGHYRDLAALIDPAKSMVTILSHQIGDTVIIIREIAHPITKKTTGQRMQLGVLQEIHEKLPDRYRDFHSAKKLAFQQANQAFHDLLIQDDRRLPAQSRKTIGPTIKNGYLAVTELEFIRPEGTEIARTVSLRCGSIAYIGDDDHEHRLDSYAQENFEQLKKTANTQLLHLTLLLTDTVINDQDVMIKITKDAADKLHGVHYSNVPTNLHGTLLGATFSNINVADIVHERAAVMPTHKKFTTTVERLSRAARVVKAAEVINIASSKEDMMNVTICASGQDRTGTAVEVATILWMVRQYEIHRVLVTRETIEIVRATGCHNAFLACLATPGSQGMKEDSASDFFMPATRKYYYRKTAGTNKIPPIDTTAVDMLISSWSQSPSKQKLVQLEAVYEKAHATIMQAETSENIEKILLAWSRQAADSLKNMPGGLFGDTLRFLKNSDPVVTSFHESKTLKQLEQLNEMIVAKKPLDEILTHFRSDINTEKMLYHDENRLCTVFLQLEKLITVCSQRLTHLHPGLHMDTKIVRH